MPEIKTVYLISHVHTDIGYTDSQNVLFRQQLEFIDRAIELCEATADYPPEARYRWTCEVASMVERYVRNRPARQAGTWRCRGRLPDPRPRRRRAES